MSRPLPKVLVVAPDEAEAVISIPALLAEALPDVHVRRLESRAAVLAALSAAKFDALVIDCDAPGFHPSELGPVFDAADGAPVLLMSWGVGEVAAVAALRAGALDWVWKSDLSALGPTLRRALPTADDAYTRVAEALTQLCERTARLKLREGHELTQHLRALEAVVARVRPAAPGKAWRARRRVGAPVGARR